MTGGGSGGHITPILSVARALKKLRTDARLVYIGHRGDPIGRLADGDQAFYKTHRIHAGKWRRYHNEGWRQLLDIKSQLLNARDVFFLGLGFLESLWLLARLRPGVIFVKGGYVGVPVAAVFPGDAFRELALVVAFERFRLRPAPLPVPSR